MEYRKLLILMLIVWNVIVFLMYGLDKYLAIKKRWRISEKALLLSTITFGGIGAFLGMKTFHHKTKHTNFKVISVIGSIITLVAFYFLAVKL